MSEIQTASVTVNVGGGRWRKRSEYLEAKDRTADLLLPLCIDTHQSPAMLIEPVEVAGLPDGTVVSRWNHEADEGGPLLVAMLTDEEKHIIVVVAWQSKSGTVPEDKFAEVVNRSWEQFHPDNP